MSRWYQINFQDANSYLIIEFIFFHDFIILFLVFLITRVFLITYFLLNQTSINLNLLENQTLERLWTLIPGLILIIMAIPSIRILYLAEEFSSFDLIIKIKGHQWFWVYQYDYFFNQEWQNSSSESFLLRSQMLKNNIFRLLDTNASLIIPNYFNTQLLLSSVDVLHSWTVPRLGVKVDAIPGRINAIALNPIRFGVFFGQCSEICGSYHRFIPIKLEIITFKDFLTLIL